MRPLRLKLQDFGSFAESELALGGLQVAGLFGANGAGKSTLLDALLWALFGEASRGGKRALDSYVRCGAEGCQVELTFELAGRLYRITRSRYLNPAKSQLTFEEQFEGAWQDRGAKSLGDTQAAIEGVLRLTYETLTACAVSPQGQSARFCQLSDTERKAVLGQILNLGQWEEWQGKAKLRLRDLELARAKCAGQQEQLRSVIDQKEALQQALREAEAGISEATAVLAEKDLALEHARAREGQAQAALKLLEELEQRRKGLKADQDRCEARRKGLLRSWKEQQALLEHKAEAQAAGEALQPLEAQLLEEERLQARQSKQQEALSLLHKAELKWERAKRGRLGEAAEARAAQNKRLETLERARQSQLAQLEAEGRALVPQLELEQQVPCAGTELSGQCKLLESARQAAKRLAELQLLLPALRAPTEAEIQLACDLERAESKLRLLEAEVWPGAEELRQAESELLQLDRGAIGAHQLEARRLRDLAALLPRLEAAEERARELKEQGAELQAQARTLEEELSALAEQGRLLAEELGDSPALLLLARKRAEGEAQTAVKRLGECQTRAGGLASRLESVAAAESQLARLWEEALRLGEERVTWELLESACNKLGGVPALIVEQAVPELERFANEFLARVMEGALALRLDTQVELKSGALGEALRITVLQQNRARDYETYSGAERFLVDLALRVALSRFLAHRAGAEIGLFVLDEGLGALDAGNRQAFCEALEALGQDFRCVLVVTHLEQLQDVFAQRLLVSKQAEGSKVELAL